MQKLEAELEKVNWNETLINNQTNDCCNVFTSQIQRIVDKFFKFCKKTRTHTQVQLPWVSDSIRQLMKKRDHSLKIFLKSKNNTDSLIFKSLRNQVLNEMRRARANYYISVLSDAKGNGKKNWKQLHCLLNPNAGVDFKYELKMSGKAISEPEQLATIFNDFFISSVEELASHFTPIETAMSVKNDPDLFEMREVDAAIVLKS